MVRVYPEYRFKNAKAHGHERVKVDEKVRDCAVLLNDGKLIAKLSGGDMVAVEAKYHTACLVSLYKAANIVRRDMLKCH